MFKGTLQIMVIGVGIGILIGTFPVADEAPLISWDMFRYTFGMIMFFIGLDWRYRGKIL